MNKFKQNFSFDEKGVKDFVQWYEEAKALESNMQELNNDNDSAINAMMNSTVTGNKQVQNGTKKYTLEAVSKMKDSPRGRAYFLKHEAEIIKSLKSQNLM